MPCYDVYLCPVVRVKIVNIEAEDPQAAIAQAIAIADLRFLEEEFISEAQEREQPPGKIVYSALADEFSHYLVDEVAPSGEVDADKSMFYLDEAHVHDGLDSCGEYPECVYPQPLFTWDLIGALKDASLHWFAEKRVRQHSEGA